MELRSPVVLFIYRREALTRQVFSAIATARPRTLLVVADGPQEGVEGDQERVAATREVVSEIPWPCDVLREYSDVNLGLRDRLASGLRWAFDNVPEAIVLEDDCVPDPSFFAFCQELLARYRSDERVMSITGENYLPREMCPADSYYFSLNPSSWGWATWRRAWRHFDVGMNAWPDFRDSGELGRLLNSPVQAQLWVAIMERAYRGLSNSWFYPWIFSCWKHHGLTARSSANLVSHVGFDDLGTHHSSGVRRSQPFPVASVGELKHPPRVERSSRLDQALFYQRFTDRSYPTDTGQAPDIPPPRSLAPDQSWLAQNVSRLEDQLVEALAGLEEKEAAIQELTSALAALQLVAGQRQELLHGSHVASANLQAQLRNKDDEIAEQHEALQTAQAAIHDLHLTARDLQIAASERMQVIERLDSEVRLLRAALAASQDECAARLGVIERLDSEVQRLRAALP